MKVATWNVNSIKQRLPHVEKWLDSHDPDVLVLQELKGLDYPDEALKTKGYQSVVKAQKGRNGVAIVTKDKAELISDQLPGMEEDEQARYLEIKYQGIHIIGMYAPNGNPVDTEKYDYKLEWLDHLINHVTRLVRSGENILITGDFNIIPEAQDCHDPSVWSDDALFRLESRKRWRTLCNLGLTDAFRVRKPQGNDYTFWDYQAGAWPQNKGIRIDHFLLSANLVDCLNDCRIESETRGWDKPSDHVPVMVDLDMDRFLSKAA